jgi:hypothetical protein
MADAPDPVVSVPSVPYDAASDGAVGPFVKLNSGPCDMQGNVAGDWPDSGVWRQT